LFRDAATAYESDADDFPPFEQAPEAGLGIGRALADAGDLPGSVRHSSMCVSGIRNGNDAEVEKALAALAVRGAQVPKLAADEHYERGKNLFRAMQYDKAMESLPRALEADPHASPAGGHASSQRESPCLTSAGAPRRRRRWNA